MSEGSNKRKAYETANIHENALVPPPMGTTEGGSVGASPSSNEGGGGTQQIVVHGDSGNKKPRSWERHRWTYKHDELLFDQVIVYQAWSKKFGGILKRWESVGKALEGEEIFRTWGNLKTDMLRRRFDKLFDTKKKSLRQKGYELGAIATHELSELEKKVIMVQDAQADGGLATENDHNRGPSTPLLTNAPHGGSTGGGGGIITGSASLGTPTGGKPTDGVGGNSSSHHKKKANKRKEELDLIKDTVLSFLKNKQDPEAVDVETSLNTVKDVTSSMKTLQSVSLDTKVPIEGDLIKKVMIEQLKLTNHLARQNDLLVSMLTKVLAKYLG